MLFSNMGPRKPQISETSSSTEKKEKNDDLHRKSLESSTAVKYWDKSRRIISIATLLGKPVYEPGQT